MKMLQISTLVLIAVCIEAQEFTSGGVNVTEVLPPTIVPTERAAAAQTGVPPASTKKSFLKKFFAAFHTPYVSMCESPNDQLTLHNRNFQEFLFKKPIFEHHYLLGNLTVLAFPLDAPRPEIRGPLVLSFACADCVSTAMACTGEKCVTECETGILSDACRKVGMNSYPYSHLFRSVLRLTLQQGIFGLLWRHGSRSNRLGQLRPSVVLVSDLEQLNI